MSEKPMKIHGEELKFPVDWEYRIIVDAARKESVRKKVEECLNSHGTFPVIQEGLHSVNGRYRTLKIPMTLANRDMMEVLSADLSKIEGVKFML